MASSSMDFLTSSSLASFLPMTTLPLAMPRDVKPLGKRPAKMRLVPMTMATRGRKSNASKAPSPFGKENSDKLCATQSGNLLKVQRSGLKLGVSVTRLGDFLKFLATNFLTKVALTFG